MESSQPKFSRRQIGHTVIELMVSLTIGLILLAAVSNIYVWSNQNNRNDKTVARMQENARFAMEAITRDLLMSGFMHNILQTTGVDSSLVTGTLSGDCGPTGTEWAIDTSALIEILPESTATQVANRFSCIDGSKLHTIDSSGTGITNAISIKRAAPASSGLVDGRIYLQTTPEGDSRLLVHNLPTNPANPLYTGADSWEYISNIYYVSKDSAEDVPTLFRKTFQGQNLGGTNDLRLDTEGRGVADGVEYFHITWGIDEEMVDGDEGTTPDGQPNYYISDPDALQLTGVVAAKIYVLVRSENINTNHVDRNTYSLGDVTIPTSGVFGDNYHRRVFSTTISLRNQIIRNTLNSLVST